MTTLSITPNPAAVYSGQSVRFFPFFSVYTGDTSPIVSSYTWDFGDGTSGIVGNTPIYQYTNTGTITTHTVTCVATLPDASTISATVVVTVMGTGDAVPTLPTDGTYQNVRMLLYDDAGNSTMVKRSSWTADGYTTSFPVTAKCSLYMLTPESVDSLDKVGTLKFQILDTGNSTAVERALVQEGVNCVYICGKEITFSGVVRRVTQNTQSGFTSTLQVKLYDIEVDSDLYRLNKLTINTTALSTSSIYDTPGYIARKILTPASGERDTRGIINCIDTKISYALNSDTTGSRYTHITTLQGNTNYDLRTRPDYLLLGYTSISTSSGVSTITISGASFTASEFVGMRLFLYMGGTTLTKDIAYGTVTANTATTITVTLNALSTNLPATGTILIHRGYLVDFAQDLTQPVVIQNFNVNKTIFNYSDNDDKRKLYTKIVAHGKDLQGSTISVALSACHAYDDEKQYFMDATHITLKSEGYVYKNNYNTSTAKSATCFYGNGGVTFNTNYASDTHAINTTSAPTSFPVNMPVYFSAGSGGVLPSAITAGTRYFIVYNNGATLYIATTFNGSPMDIGSDASGTVDISTRGTLKVDNADGGFTPGSSVIVTAAVLPSGLSTNTLYYCGPPNAVTSNYYLELYSDSSYSTPVTFGYPTAGSGIYVYHASGIYNTELGYSPMVWLYGWGYTIPSGSSMAYSIPNTSSTAATTSGATTEGTDGSGVQYTAVPVSAFSSVDFSGKGYFLNIRLYVDHAAYVGTNQVLIGEEKITVDSMGTDTTYGDYIQFASVTARKTDSTLKCYPHGIGCLVARTNYTEDAPQAGLAYITNFNNGGLSAIIKFTETTWIALDSAYVSRTVDGGTTWTVILGPPWYSCNTVIRFDSLTAVAATGDSHMRRTVDGGTTWTDLGVVDSFSSNEGGSKMSIAVNSLVGYMISYSSRKVWKTTDSGLTWVNTGTIPYIYYGYSQAAAFSPTILCAPNNDDIYGTRCISRSIDSGATWTTITVDSTPGSNITCVVAYSSTVGVATDYAGNIWRTIDAGLTWTLVYTFPTSWAVFGVVENNAMFWRSYNNVLYASYDSGLTWDSYSLGGNSINQIVYNGKIFAFTSGGNEYVIGPGSQSALYTYGKYIDDATVDSSITYGDLDTYATNLLLGLGNFYRKATCWTLQIYGTVIGVGGYYAGIYQQTLLRPIRIGDRISITPFSGDNPVEYQVIEIDYNYDQATLTLTLGDYEKNMFTDILTTTSAINKTLT